jgi:hypothetical protein
MAADYSTPPNDFGDNAAGGFWGGFGNIITPLASAFGSYSNAMTARQTANQATQLAAANAKKTTSVTPWLVGGAVVVVVFIALVALRKR